MARNKRRQNKQPKKNHSKKRSNQKDKPSTKGKDGYKLSHLKSTLAEKEAVIKAKDEEIESLKKDVKIKELEAKKENETIVILEEKNGEKIELDKIMAQRDFNVGTIRELKSYRVNTLKAETESTLQIMEAEKNSPEAQREFYKLKIKTIAHASFMVLGIFILILAFITDNLIHMIFWGSFGIAFIIIGMAHFVTDEGIAKAEKLIKFFPKLTHEEKKNDNMALEYDNDDK